MATYISGASKASKEDVNKVSRGGTFVLKFRRIWQETDLESMRYWYLEFEYESGVVQSFKMNQTMSYFKGVMNLRPTMHYIVHHDWGIISEMSDMFRFSIRDANKILLGNLYEPDSLEWVNAGFLSREKWNKQKYVEKLKDRIDGMREISQEFLSKADSHVFDLLFPYKESTHWFKTQRDTHKEGSPKWKQFDLELKRVEERNANSRKKYLKTKKKSLM